MKLAISVLALLVVVGSGSAADAKPSNRGGIYCNGVTVPCHPPKPLPKPCSGIAVPCKPQPPKPTPRPCPTFTGECKPCPAFAPCTPIGKPGTSTMFPGSLKH